MNHRLWRWATCIAFLLWLPLSHKERGPGGEVGGGNAVFHLLGRIHGDGGDALAVASASREANGMRARRQAHLNSASRAETATHRRCPHQRLKLWPIRFEVVSLPL